MIVARQKKQVLSWQVPLVVDSEFGGTPFWSTGRMLCRDAALNELLSEVDGRYI